MFEGDGYSIQPFEPKERAQHREAVAVLAKKLPVIENIESLTKGLNLVSVIITKGGTIMLFCFGVGAIGRFIGWY